MQWMSDFKLNDRYYMIHSEKSYVWLKYIHTEGLWEKFQNVMYPIPLLSGKNIANHNNNNNNNNNNNRSD